MAGWLNNTGYNASQFHLPQGRRMSQGLGNGACRQSSQSPTPAELVRMQRDLAIALGATDDLNVALDLILSVAIRIPPIELGGIYLVAPDGMRVELVAHKNLSDQFLDAVRSYHRGSPQLDVVCSGQTAIQPSLAPDGSLGAACIAEGIRFLIVVPVVHDGRPVACLNVGSRTADAIDSVARDALESLAAWIGGVIARIQAEEAHREAEAKLRDLLAHLPDAIIEADPQGRILVASRSIGALSAEQLVGRPCADFVHPEDLEQAQRVFREVVETLQPRLTEVRDCRGEYWLTRVAPRCIGERLSGVLLISTNITPLKRHAQSLIEERDGLRRVFRSQERDYRSMALSIHNQLAQQLTAVGMLLDRCLQQSPRTSAETDSLLARCRGLLADLMPTVRRMIGGLRPLILDELGLAAAVEFLVNERQEGDGARTEFRCDLRTDRFHADIEDAAFRIVQELLRNAIRHSDSPKIVVELVEEDGSLRLSVEDFGCGFDPNEVPDDCLGLARIAAIARLFDTQLQIRSELGRGVRAEVCLPVQWPPAKS